MQRQTPLRQELLVQFGFLFGGVVLMAGIGLFLLLPVLSSPTQAALFIVTLIVAELAVLFAFGSWLLGKLLVQPMERLSADAERIASGDYHHRIQVADSLELRQIQDSVNGMADRLIADQISLADNIVSLDLTNRELIEARDQVLHTARLASVGTLAAGIAHEVGNPLGAIIGYVDVAKSRAARISGDVELLDLIRGEAKRIDRIVRGLLDYARPKEFEFVATSPTDVLARVRDLLEAQGAMDGIRATWGVVGNPPDVVIQPHQLEQVMVNLLLNAVDALRGHPDPQISVQIFDEDGAVSRMPARRAEDHQGINYLHRRRISLDDGGRGIDALFNARVVAVMRVDDNGPGIPDGDLENIFDPFFTTKEPGKGTGLGLSICARLVEGMGGRIQAENRPEGGASFTVRLPAAILDDGDGDETDAGNPRGPQ